MAEAVVFHYRDAETPLHRLDPRTKLASLLLLTMSMVLLPDPSPAVIGGYALALAIAAGLPVGSFKREMRVFVILGTVIFIGRFFTTDITEALWAAARFFTVVILGLVLMDTTAPEDCASGLYWFLAIFSPSFAGRFAARLMLTLAFIPLIFDSISEVREARKSRMERPSRRPLRFLLSFLEQVFDIILVQAEEISLALESRGFTGSMKPKPLKFSYRDLAAAGITIGIMILASLDIGPRT